MPTEIGALLAAAVRHWADFTIIFIMPLVNAGVGFGQQFKAETAIASLNQRLAPQARVLRNGTWRDISARLLVPGDVNLLRWATPSRLTSGSWRENISGSISRH